jgi:hypothetical protein
MDPKAQCYAQSPLQQSKRKKCRSSGSRSNTKRTTAVAPACWMEAYQKVMKLSLTQMTQLGLRLVIPGPFTNRKLRLVIPGSLPNADFLVSLCADDVDEKNPFWFWFWSFDKDRPDFSVLFPNSIAKKNHMAFFSESLKV